MNDQNNIEQFGNFMSAPTVQPPPIPTQTPTLNELMKSNEKYIVDNNTLYKKLFELESEIKQLKNMISNLQYPQSVYYPTQPFSPRPNIMTPIINNSVMNPNQTHFF
jgi:hypothetical protein